jgi:hypothetical protein
MDREFIPPIRDFTNRCNLKQVHVAAFNSESQSVSALISKLQANTTLGQLKVTIDCTEKSFPVFGRMKYKTKEFLKNVWLAYDPSLISRLSESHRKQEFDKESAVNLYLNFLNYLDRQSVPIIKALEDLKTEGAAYPTENNDEKIITARRILLVKDEAFRQLLDELDKHSQTYREIMIILREKDHAEFTDTRGRYHCLGNG